MQYVNGKVNKEHRLLDKIFIAVLGLIIGAILGWSIIDNAITRSCEPMGDAYGNRWVECDVH